MERPYTSTSSTQGTAGTSRRRRPPGSAGRRAGRSSARARIRRACGARSSYACSRANDVSARLIAGRAVSSGTAPSTHRLVGRRDHVRAEAGRERRRDRRRKPEERGRRRRGEREPGRAAAEPRRCGRDAERTRERAGVERVEVADLAPRSGPGHRGAPPPPAREPARPRSPRGRRPCSPGLERARACTPCGCRRSCRRRSPAPPLRSPSARHAAGAVRPAGRTGS